MKPNIALFAWLCLAGFASPVHALSGTVHDLKGKGLSGISMRFVMEQDTSVQLEVTSGEQGKWVLPDAVGIAKARKQRRHLAAPKSLAFSSGVRIPWIAEIAGEVSWDILDLRGRRIHGGSDQAVAGREGIIDWDGRSTEGAWVPSGMYVLRISGAAGNAVVRLFKTAGMGAWNAREVSPVLRAELAAQRAFWNQGVSWQVRVQADGYEPLRLASIKTDSFNLNLALCPRLAVPYGTGGKYLGRRNAQGALDTLFLRGVNLGVAIPGTQPGEMAATRAQIRRWLHRIGEAGFNSIRTYTLHFPHFYEELAAYNNDHWQAPLYLFQGVWLDEELPADLYTSSESFLEAMKEVVDCVHGNREIDPRFGRAYGRYRSNVSPWIMGWIVGREVYPDQILETDRNNPIRTSYAGEAVSMPHGTPSEVWFVQALDGMVRHELAVYGSQRPVSVSSWPTLDPLPHPSEVYPSQEDDATLDMNGIDMSKAPGGYFASYHAYPYYPDFMGVEIGLQSAADATGPNSYLGYLKAMRAHYDKVPLLVAEFGVPSSWGNAHFAPSGMHHGGHDEVAQGKYDVRQLENIHSTGCAGGFVFSWIDEWFKNAWITEPMSTKADRRHLWHNLTNPEQNFGLVSFDVPDPQWSIEPVTASSCGLGVQAQVDHSFYHLRIQLGAVWKPGDLVEIGLDTYDKDKGEAILPSGATVANRSEFCVRLQGDSARLLVTQAYDLFGIWHGVSAASQLFHSTATNGAAWNLVRWKNNRGEADIFEIGKLRVRQPGAAATSLDAVTFHGDTVDIKIPWTLLQFTDPSLGDVMDDDRSTRTTREVSATDGIAATVVKADCRVESPRFSWPTWNVAPETREREKASLGVLEQAIKTRAWPLQP
ncbi:MAG: hypothetical protein RL318_90 [Fibrobacterota bacterium]|jgi:hypothetical protein